jgi:hypothetical protein
MLNWLSLLFSEGEGEPSIRRVVFFLSFIFGVVLCLIGFWCDISPPVERVAITIIGAAFGVMGVGRIAEAVERQGK